MKPNTNDKRCFKLNYVRLKCFSSFEDSIKHYGLLVSYKNELLWDWYQFDGLHKPVGDLRDADKQEEEDDGVQDGAARPLPDLGPTLYQTILPEIAAVQIITRLRYNIWPSHWDDTDLRGSLPVGTSDLLFILFGFSCIA